MRNYTGLVATILLGSCLEPYSLAVDDVSVVSPGGKVKCRVALNAGGLTFAVALEDQPVIITSPMGVGLDDADLTSGVQIGTVERYRIHESYPWRGVHSRAVNDANGARVALEHNPIGKAYTLDVRAADDAVAFRFVIPNERGVPAESTTFKLPAGSSVWYHGLRGHYEGPHDKKDAAEVPADTWVAPPFTFALPGGAGYAAITEAALVNYAGMALQAMGDRAFAVRLGHQHPISYPYQLRFSPEDVARVSRPAVIVGTITTPWRVVMVGADLNALVNCDAVHNLCPPADPTLFPEGMATGWVKPGRAVWEWLDGKKATLEEMKEYTRMAGELGFEYNVLEGFWRRWSDDQVRELTDYGKQRGVGIWVWTASNDLANAETRRDFFKRCHDLGIVGVKIDFLDHEAKEVIDHYQALLRGAAENRLMVNFHGSNKPTGEARTWPNELTREAVKGLETRPDGRAIHDVTVPFTRYLAGHGDYTPMHFGANKRGETSWTHQIASAVIFESPLLTFAASARNILANPALEMIKSISAVWDETVVLPSSKIGEVAAFARRSGDTWILAVMNGLTARKLTVRESFLGEGPYRALIVRDRSGDPAAVDIENSTGNRFKELPLDLEAGGGFVARFTRD
jgi:alpha-glucosidase